MNNNKDDVIEIDLLRLMKALWKRAWAIALAMAICGGLALGYTMMFVKPLYKASVLMYVNSSNISVGGTKVSISQAELSAAKTLVDTYVVILNTRTTLNEVIEQSGVTYTYEELSKMISAQAVNNTEVFKIEVTSQSPQEAANIANTIAQILPEKISSIVEGTSARIVDSAVTPSRKSSPSNSKNLIVGMLLGAVLSCGIVVIQELLDDKIHDTDYLRQTYDLPMLAVVPDLLTDNGDSAYGDYRNVSTTHGGHSNGKKH